MHRGAVIFLLECETAEHNCARTFPHKMTEQRDTGATCVGPGNSEP